METIVGHYVEGALLAGTPDGATPVENPTTGQVIGLCGEAQPSLVLDAVAAAAAAAPAWAALRLEERLRYLDRWRELLAGAADELVELTVDELGITPDFARRIHIGRTIGCLEHLGGLTGRALEPRTEGNSLVVREPAGVIAAITAWNFPLHMLVSKVSAALATGSTVVAKPSEVKPLAAWRAVQLLFAAGLPPGVVNVVNGRGPTVGAQLVADARVDLVCFTGSRETGRGILAACAGDIRRCVLELGGKSAAVLLPGAPLDEALAAVVGSFTFNNGQVCGAQSRLLVTRKAYDETAATLSRLVDTVVVGDPRVQGVTLGPVVSAAQYARVGGYVEAAVESGLPVLAGGAGRPARLERGYFVRPTVFTEVPPEHLIAQEEIFGPVLAVQICEDVDELVEVANSTRYGLAGSVWGPSTEEAVAVARRLRSGQVQVNGGAFNLLAPYGGVKESGIGREHGVEGLQELTEVKSLQLPS
jgi:aldehyde dehydrogenase (NAD+)/betaine-aldehyde dehydrogenase